jgi:hypothetical protein
MYDALTNLNSYHFRSEERRISWPNFNVTKYLYDIEEGHRDLDLNEAVVFLKDFII